MSSGRQEAHGRPVSLVTPERAAPMHEGAPTLGQAARYWWRLGLISFGGPAGQIALMHGELVERRRWLSERRFLHALNFCMLLPGPEATQLATYLGWLMHGTRGGLVAGGLFLLPSVLVLLGLASLYALWGEVPVLASVFWGLRAAVLAIVLQAAWRLGRRTLHNPLLVAIAAAACLALAVGQVPYPALIVATALVGWIGGRLRPDSVPTARPPLHGAGRARRPARMRPFTATPPHPRARPLPLAPARPHPAGGRPGPRPAPGPADAGGRLERPAGHHGPVLHPGGPGQLRRVPMPCCPMWPRGRWRRSAGWTPARWSTAWPWGRPRRGR